MGLILDMGYPLAMVKPGALCDGTRAGNLGYCVDKSEERRIVEGSTLKRREAGDNRKYRDYMIARGNG